ncbi:MAG: RdgB/HAM1 family non-canonical purine NTP pyrophosphatase [Cyclobacteriaceae bacterium]|nr:RdgB/HAM1 family non-canonical purine NTP pyrophosphatase [Cyclobacteriaceae bacterium]
MKICFATNNLNKLQEIRRILGDRYEIYGLHELGITGDIPEDGSTLEENSRFKARYVYQRENVPVFADDTGLEVIALHGEPGVISARYAGPERNNMNNIHLLLQKLRNVTDRRAQFKTVVTYIDERGDEFLFEGIAKGEIIESLKGAMGFGYDPVFVPEGYDRTFAEMTMEEKNQISHRGKAIQLFVAFLKARENGGV